MGTPCWIAITDEDNSVDYVYCHAGSALTAEVLHTHVTTFEAAEELVMGGELSSIIGSADYTESEYSRPEPAYMEESNIVAEYYKNWIGRAHEAKSTQRVYDGLRGLRKRFERIGGVDYVYAYVDGKWLVHNRSLGCWIEVDYWLKQRAKE